MTGFSLSINNSKDEDLYCLNISLILDLKDFIPSEVGVTITLLLLCFLKLKPKKSNPSRI